MMMGTNKNSGIPMNQEDDGMDEDMPERNQISGKLLAIQNMLDSIAQMSDEDLTPYIEKAKNALHMAHESAEGDELGVQEGEEHEANMDNTGMMLKKPGIDVEIGLGGPQNSSEAGERATEDAEGSGEEEEDGAGPAKGGFLAILQKRMKNKG